MSAPTSTPLPFRPRSAVIWSDAVIAQTAEKGSPLQPAGGIFVCKSRNGSYGEIERERERKTEESLAALCFLRGV